MRSHAFAFGVLGYFMDCPRVSRVPFLLAFILGPLNDGIQNFFGLWSFAGRIPEIFFQRARNQHSTPLGSHLVFALRDVDPRPSQG